MRASDSFVFVLLLATAFLAAGDKPTLGAADSVLHQPEFQMLVPKKFNSRSHVDTSEYDQDLAIKINQLVKQVKKEFKDDKGQFKCDESSVKALMTKVEWLDEHLKHKYTHIHLGGPKIPMHEIKKVGKLMDAAKLVELAAKQAEKMGLKSELMAHNLHRLDQGQDATDKVGARTAAKAAHRAKRMAAIAKQRLTNALKDLHRCMQSAKQSGSAHAKDACKDAKAAVKKIMDAMGRTTDVNQLAAALQAGRFSAEAMAGHIFNDNFRKMKGLIKADMRDMKSVLKLVKKADGALPRLLGGHRGFKKAMNNVQHAKDIVRFMAKNGFDIGKLMGKSQLMGDKAEVKQLQKDLARVAVAKEDIEKAKRELGQVTLKDKGFNDKVKSSLIKALLKAGLIKDINDPRLAMMTAKDAAKMLAAAGLDASKFADAEVAAAIRLAEKIAKGDLDAAKELVATEMAITSKRAAMLKRHMKKQEHKRTVVYALTLAKEREKYKDAKLSDPAFNKKVKSTMMDALVAAGIIKNPNDPKWANMSAQDAAKLLCSAGINPKSIKDSTLGMAVRMACKISKGDVEAARDLMAHEDTVKKLGQAYGHSGINAFDKAGGKLSLSAAANQAHKTAQDAIAQIEAAERLDRVKNEAKRKALGLSHELEKALREQRRIVQAEAKVTKRGMKPYLNLKKELTAEEIAAAEAMKFGNAELARQNAQAAAVAKEALYSLRPVKAKIAGISLVGQDLLDALGLAANAAGHGIMSSEKNAKYLAKLNKHVAEAERRARAKCARERRRCTAEEIAAIRKKAMASFVKMHGRGAFKWPFFRKDAAAAGKHAVAHASALDKHIASLPQGKHALKNPKFNARTRNALMDALVKAGIIKNPNDPKWANLSAEAAAKMLAGAGIDPSTVKDPTLRAALRLAKRIAAGDADAARELVAHHEVHHHKVKHALKKYANSKLSHPHFNNKVKNAMMAALVKAGIIKNPNDPKWRNLSAQDAAKLLHSAGLDPSKISDPQLRAAVLAAGKIAKGDTHAARLFMAHHDVHHDKLKKYHAKYATKTLSDKKFNSKVAGPMIDALVKAGFCKNVDDPKCANLTAQEAARHVHRLVKEGKLDISKIDNPAIKQAILLAGKIANGDVHAARKLAGFIDFNHHNNARLSAAGRGLANFKSHNISRKAFGNVHAGRSAYGNLIGVGAKRFAGPNGVSFNPKSGGIAAADAIAHALGVDPKKMFADASSRARAAGYCKSTCTAADIKRWSQSLPASERAKLPAALRAYTDAFAGRSKAFDGGKEAASAVAKALGLDPRKMEQQLKAAAMAAGFCSSSGCTPAELKRYAIKMGDSLPGNLGRYAKAWAGRTATPIKGILGHRVRISPSQGRSAAAKAAKALGVDPAVLHRQAVDAARAAGYCKSTCTNADIQKWAREQGHKFPGNLGKYASAFAGPKFRGHGFKLNDMGHPGGKQAADAVARALGVSAKVLHAQAVQAAQAAGFCKATCSEADIRRWAAANRHKLTGPLKHYASAFCGHPDAIKLVHRHDGGADRAAAIARALGKDPKVLFQQAAAAARTAGFCKATCTEADIKRWARSVPAGSIPGALGAYVSAFGGHKGVAGVTLPHTQQSFAAKMANAKARWGCTSVPQQPAAVGCAAVGAAQPAQPIIIKVPVLVPVPVPVPVPAPAPRAPVYQPPPVFQQPIQQPCVPAAPACQVGR